MGIHNTDVVTALTIQIEVLGKKLDNLTQNMNTVHQPAPACKGCGTNHATVMYRILKGNKTILTQTCISRLEESSELLMV